MKKSRHNQTVHFEFASRAARKVCLAGSFNHWNPDAAQMTLVGNGKWVKELELTPGTYEYRLVVDGNWISDPNADHAVMNPFGERNSLLVVSSKK